MAMISIVGDSTVAVRADQVQRDTALARSAVLGSSGAVIQVGDLQWEPDVLTLTCMVGSGDAAAAWTARAALLAAAESATELDLPTGTVAVHGLLEARVTPRPLGWQVMLRFAASGEDASLPSGWDTPLADPQGDLPEPEWDGPQTFAPAVFGVAANGNAVGLTAAGVSVWTVSLWTGSAEYPNDFTTDPDDGSLYVVTQIGTGGRVRRLDPSDGSVIWAVDVTDIPTHVAVQSAAGRLYWVSSSTVYAVAKIDGSALWTYVPSITGTIWALAADASHVFYWVRGDTTTTLVRLSSAGAPADDGAWPIETTDYFDFNTEIVVDDAGALYVTGHSPKDGSYRWLRVLKINADGSQAWEAQLVQGAGANLAGYAIAIADDRSVWVLARQGSELSHTLIWHVKADGTVDGYGKDRYSQLGYPSGSGFAGNLLFFNDGYTSSIRSYDIVADSVSGHGYIGGTFDVAIVAVSHMGLRP